MFTVSVRAGAVMGAHVRVGFEWYVRQLSLLARLPLVGEKQDVFTLVSRADNKYFAFEFHSI